MILQALNSIKKRPGTVATVVKLLSEAGDFEGSLEFLEHTIKSFNESDDAVNRARIQEGDACHKLMNGMYRDAAAVLKKLMDSGDQDGGNLRRVALLVTAL